MNKDVIILDILETHIKYEKYLSPINQKCLLEYIENLQKKAEQGEHYKHLYSEVKKQKDDVVIKYIKYLIKRLEEFDILERKETGAFWYQVMGELKELLRMLGEIDVED